MNIDLLLGQSDSEIDFDSVEKPLHRGVIKDFIRLKKDAAIAGFDLAIASSYRDFDRQLLIWNEKAEGKRQLLDSSGEVLDVRVLSPWSLVQAILRWSALPGASRHHWGTDIDIYDRSAVTADYEVQLTPDEVDEGGPFAPLHRWLDQQFENNKAYGFFRPYEYDTGGIAPERWHISYAPLAASYQAALSPAVLQGCCKGSPLLLSAVVEERLNEIFERYIMVSSEQYPSAYRHLLQP
jgi:LAS superfamily LD-carboxypeptidase LdcB